MQIKIPYRPRYPEVHRTLETKRFVVLVAHRRFGKTVLAINHLIKSALCCRKRGGHFGYVAPLRTQAKSVAWDYLKHYTAPIPQAKRNETELSITLPSPAGPAKIRLFGADNPDSLRGLYFDCVILDEVAQMKSEVWGEIIQPCLADRQGSAVFIGTPKGINLFSEQYYYACQEQGAGSPDWAALNYPIHRTNALPEAEIERLKRELSDNKFRQEMLCDFSASADDILITIDEAEAAIKREPDNELAGKYPLVLGCDIARFGEDSTVLFPRQGLVTYKPLIYRKKSNTDIAQRILAWIHEYRPANVNIDQGQGTGVIDLLRDLHGSRSCVITEIPFGSRAINDSRYINRRAEMWCDMRDWIRNGGSLPADPEIALCLKGELTAACYSFDAQGRLKLEPKEEIKKRLKRSTDLADALALTFALPAPPVDLLPARYGRHKKKKMYDPFK